MLQGCWYQGAQLPEDAEEGVRAPEKGSSAEGIQVHAHSGWPGGGKKVLGSEPLGPQRQNSDGPGMGVTNLSLWAIFRGHGDGSCQGLVLIIRWGLERLLRVESKL